MTVSIKNSFVLRFLSFFLNFLLLLMAYKKRVNIGKARVVLLGMNHIAGVI